MNDASGGVGERPGVGHEQAGAVEHAVRRDRPGLDELVVRSVGVEDVDAAAVDGGHEQPAVGGDGDPVGDRLVPGQQADVLDAAPSGGSA